MLGRTLLNLDRVGRTLDPAFDPNEAIRTHVADILRQRMWKQASPGRVAASLREMNDFVQEIPTRLNRTLDLLASSQVRLRVDAFDEVYMMEGLRKIANRITLGLVVAALIMGAAMLMRVETNFTLLGYPGLAMILFMGAVAGGFALVASIVRTDESSARDHGGQGRASADPSPPWLSSTPSSQQADMNPDPHPTPSSGIPRSAIQGVLALVLVLVLLGVGYALGVRPVDDLRARAQQADTRAEASDARVGELESRLEATHALALLYRTMLDVDARNFGTANDRLNEAAAALDRVNREAIGSAADEVDALRAELRSLDIRVAEDLSNQRSRVADMARRLAAALGG
jgi:hypothetical protein